MDERSVWIGIDIGTTSVKVSVIDDERDELAFKTENTNAEIKSNFGDNGFEQCPQKIVEVVERTIQNVLFSCLGKTKIKGIGVCGQMHGVVLWKKDKGGHILESQKEPGEPHNEKSLLSHAQNSNPSNLFTWQDQRCSPSFLGTLPKPSNDKLPLSTGHGCATLFWLSRTSHDSTLEKGQFDCCGTIIDYFIYLLCGLEHPMTSDQLAASLGYLNQETMEWDSALTDTPEFPSHMMPSVIKAGKQAGVVRPSLSGWPCGVPVLVGMGDVQCAMAAVIKSPLQAAVNISTSIQLGFPVSSLKIPQIEKESPPSISFFPYFGQEHLALCAGLNGGNAIKYFVECVASWMKQLGFDEDSCSTSKVFTRLEQLAMKDLKKRLDPEEKKRTSAIENLDYLDCINESSPELTVRPAFHGERHNPSLYGEICNISLTNFQNIGHIYHRVCEGVVNHLSTMVPPSYLKRLGIKELLVCGSVPERNPTIMSTLQIVYTEGDLSVPVKGYGDATWMSSASGAANIAMTVLNDKIK